MCLAYEMLENLLKPIDLEQPVSCLDLPTNFLYPYRVSDKLQSIQFLGGAQEHSELIISKLHGALLDTCGKIPLECDIKECLG